MLSEDEYTKFVQGRKAFYEEMVRAGGARQARISLRSERALWLNPKSTSLVRAHPEMRRDMVRAHRQVELELFGDVSDLPGERELLDEPRSRPSAKVPTDVATASPNAGTTVSQAQPPPSAEKLPVATEHAAASILAAAVVCTQQVEKACTEEGFTDEHFQDVVIEFANLLIHLFLRQAFDQLGPERGGGISDLVAKEVYQLGKSNGPISAEHPIAAFTRKIEPGITVEGHGWDLLQERQAEYERLALFAAKDAPLAGTVFWEFGKYIAKVCDQYGHNAGMRIEALLIASSAHVKLYRLFGEIIESLQNHSVASVRATTATPRSEGSSIHRSSDNPPSQAAKTWQQIAASLPISLTDDPASVPSKSIENQRNIGAASTRMVGRPIFPALILAPLFVITSLLWAFGPAWAWAPFTVMFGSLSLLVVAVGPNHIAMRAPSAAQSTSATFSLTQVLAVGVGIVLLVRGRYSEIALCVAIYLVSAFLWPRLRTFDRFLE